VVVLVEDESLRAESLRIVQAVRESGRSVEFSLVPAKGDKQFKRALELGAARTLRVERGEDSQLRVRIKDLKSREERTVPLGEWTVDL
jgi:histidyl-tRNA synthetase